MSGGPVVSRPCAPVTPVRRGRLLSSAVVAQGDRTMRPSRALPPLLMLALAACGPAPDPAAAAKDKARADAAAAEAMAAELETQLGNENWTLARAHCDVLAFRFPGSAVVKRYAVRCADAKSRADAQAETARLQGLWSYQTSAVGKGEQRNASIYSKDDIDIDTGAGSSHVRLIFRDHPEWGRSSYLVLDNGDFDCYGGCRLEVRIDGKPRTMAGTRPKTDEAIAMFIEDERGLWRAIRKARTLAIDVPLKGAKTQPVEFEVGGLDASRMPGW
jgi:hypothetical protein